MRAAVFGPRPGRRRNWRHLARHLCAALLERMHRAGLGELDDLRLDRRADAGQLLRLAGERELRDRRRCLADARRGATVGEHAEALLAEDLGDVGEHVERVGDVRVARQRRHPPIIGRTVAGVGAGRLRA